MKKKLFAIIFAATTFWCLAIPTFACTPTLKPPKIPTIPDISGSIDVEIPDSVFDNWFRDHPIKIVAERGEHA